MLHTLDRLAGVHRSDDEFGRAVEYALMAIRLEPLRESAHRQLVATHVAQGNLSEVARQFRIYRDLLATELGVDPSPLMTELVAGAGLDPDLL